MAETDQPAENGESTSGETNSPAEAQASEEGSTSGELKDLVFHADSGDRTQEPVEEPPASAKAKHSEYFILYAGVAALAVVAIVILLFNLPKSKAGGNDLGAGVFNSSGLRGHLLTRWQKGQTQYQLEIQAIDPRSNAGFAQVAGDPPQPISINIRIMDSSGFALCGKEIIMPFDPSREFPMLKKAALTGGGISGELAKQQQDLLILQAEEQDRERGKDIFHNQIGSDGTVRAMDAQGVLPCSADQFKRFDYWDFSTNFPSMEEQDRLLKHPRDLLAFTGSAEARNKRKASNQLRSAFYVEGDDTATGWEASSGNLVTSMNRTFLVPGKSAQAIAASWAADDAHFHYKCDQRANCALIHAGSATAISARLNE
ncbi:MAG TPA: hypothetical protein VMU48_07260 [Terracidiphilus sp.]|nr:hypothetical protein [Terracidiphilus sp.]